nr:RsiV family protein [Lactobacillus delbrueckii]
MVIVFNQGEVGPMSMGSQSFVLPNKLVAKLQR